MKAAQIREYGDAGVITVERNAPAPAAGKGRVLVKVHAASLNPVDSAVRAGYMQKMAPLQFPVTLGCDIAGVVSEVGSGVRHVRVGDRVFGSASALGGASGAFAELASVAEGQIAKIPDKLGFVEAAALPLAGASAVQAFETLDLKAGQRLLVLGGSGGIGVLAIQLAKALGARVTATARGKGVAFVKGLGADTVIDLGKDSLRGLPADFDAVLANVGGDLLQSSLETVRKGGTIVSLAGTPDAALAEKRGVKASLQLTQVTTARLDGLARMAAEGKLRVPVQRTFPLEHVRDAFAQRERGGVLGKLVLQIV
jgi:NADPH:quinone reductase-like Zn-dependent oxidoreductase